MTWRGPSREDVDARLAGYIADVLRGARIVGRLERLAVERHVRDLEDGAARGLRFNAGRAARAVWWIEAKLRFADDEWAGRPFLLEPWQVFVVAMLFGWERKVGDAWIRRFRTGYLSMARKNAKSYTAAGIALLLLMTGGAKLRASGNGFAPVEGAELYSAATTRDQAAIVWTAAAKIAKRSPEIRKRLDVPARLVKTVRFNMAFHEAAAYFRALAADSDTLDGLNPYAAIVDELHAHKDGSVWDVLRSGMGARLEPLTIAITTAGAERDGVCWEVETDAIKVLEQVYEDDTLFGFICRLDEKDDPFVESNWPKANPNLGVSVKLDGLRIDAREAATNPARRNEYLRKRMNLWTSGETAWVGLDAWDSCAGMVDLDALRGRTCYLGFDLGSTHDTTAVVAAFPMDDGKILIHPWVFVPADTIAEGSVRGPRERELLNRWIRDGLVIATPGDVVDFDAVWQVALNVADRYNLAAAVFDPWQASSLIGKCQAVGIPDLAFRQGYRTMSPAIKELEVMISRRELVHSGNPVLRWMVSNVAVVTDPAGNVKFDKRQATRRIDGVIAAVMAVGTARTKPEQAGGVAIWGIQ